MIQAGQVANLLLATINIALVFTLAWLISGSRVALLSAILYAAIPSRLFFTSALMSEEAFVTVVLLALLALILGVRNQEWVVVSAIGFGLAIAAAAFIRPLGVVLLPLPLVLLFSKSVSPRIPIAQFGVATVVVGVMLLPWSLRNHNEVGGLNLVSNNGGINLWIGCHLNEDGNLASNGKWMDWWSGDAPAEINTTDERANDHEAQRLAFQCMREQPASFVRLSLLKGLYTFREDWEYVSKWSINHRLPERSTEGIVSQSTEEAFGYLSNSVYLALMPLAVVGALAFFFGPSIFRGVIGASFAALAFVPLAFFGEPRFHVPLFPMMSIWAAEGILIVLHGLRSVGSQRQQDGPLESAPAGPLKWEEEPWLK
jgi:4-amino-4-deoxy-L-arabinose transferase-like glycosyltransferase